MRFDSSLSTMNEKERYDYILARLKEMVEENKVKSKSLTKNNKNGVKN